jgi:hypothetical protein
MTPAEAAQVFVDAATYTGEAKHLPVRDRLRPAPG